MPAYHIINPYAEHLHNGSLYLIGHCHMRKDIRTVVVDRIQKIKLTAESFAMLPVFSLERYLRHSSGMFTEELVRVKVRFHQMYDGFGRDPRCYRCVALGSLRNHGEAKGSEIAVKSKRRHVIEERGYNYK